MLLTCPSCNSRYLVNSADLKPIGRTVKCAMCRHEWFQDPDLKNQEFENLEESLSDTQETQGSVTKEEDNTRSNLPSTYVKTENPSLVNSILTMLFVILLFFIFLLIKNEGWGTLDLMHYYFEELSFQLRSIVNDFAKTIYLLIN